MMERDEKKWNKEKEEGDGKRKEKKVTVNVE
jgi:hypothetical protein